MLGKFVGDEANDKAISEMYKRITACIEIDEIDLLLSSIDSTLRDLRKRKCNPNIMFIPNSYEIVSLLDQSPASSFPRDIKSKLQDFILKYKDLFVFYWPCSGVRLNSILIMDCQKFLHSDFEEIDSTGRIKMNVKELNSEEIESLLEGEKQKAMKARLDLEFCGSKEILRKTRIMIKVESIVHYGIVDGQAAQKLKCNFLPSD